MEYGGLLRHIRIFIFFVESSFSHVENGIRLLALEKTYNLISISIFIPIASVSIFMGFHLLEVKNSKLMNYLGASIFGVYLLSDSSILRSII